MDNWEYVTVFPKMLGLAGLDGGWGTPAPCSFNLEVLPSSIKQGLCRLHSNLLGDGIQLGSEATSVADQCYWSAAATETKLEQILWQDKEINTFFFFLKSWLMHWTVFPLPHFLTSNCWMKLRLYWYRLYVLKCMMSKIFVKSSYNALIKIRR